VRHALRRGRCAFALAWPHNPPSAARPQQAPCRAAGTKPVAQPDIRVEPEEFIAAGDDKVIVPSQLVARGTGSDRVVGASGN